MIIEKRLIAGHLLLLGLWLFFFFSMQILLTDPGKPAPVLEGNHIKN
jgi:hypothetical protein